MKTLVLLITMFTLSFSVFSKENNQIRPEKTISQQSIEIEKIPNLLIKLQTPTNWYILLLPLITIAIVIVSAYMSIKTLNSKTEEAKNAFTESLKSQREISEKEVKMNVLSDSRQKWINSLRDELSELISFLHHIEMSKDIPLDNNSVAMISKMELKVAKITLLINPNESKHKELVKLINAAANDFQGGYKELFTHNKNIISLSQEILKEEWEVLKKFK